MSYKQRLLKNRPFDTEKALLVGIRRPTDTVFEFQDSLEELRSLAYTAGANVAGVVSQEVKRIEPSTYLGKGKVEEIKNLVKELCCNVVLIDQDLSASQNRNLEKELKVKVVDRTGLILDIFSQRARTREGKLQVELAQCLYLQPRLVGQWEHFSRQTGGIGTRGPGETQLEVDRRRLRERVVHIKRELERVQSSRELHRAKRQSVPIPTISLVGYTNAGKSTLMRSLTQANVLVEDKLFATLDPTIRRLKLPSGRQALLADTVGFIKKLPHALVESFKATFEEIEGSDILVHVIDASHPMREHQIRQVYEVLEELGLSKKPVVEVYNKIDLMGYNHQEKKGKIGISALRQEGLDLLLQKLDRLLSRGYKKIQLLIPYQEGALLSFLHDSARVITKNYAEDGVHLEVEVFEKYLAQLKKFKVK